MILMAVVIYDDVNLFSLDPGRISKFRLEWSKNIVLFIIFLSKEKHWNDCIYIRQNIFLLLLLYRETLIILDSLLSIVLDLFEPLIFYYLVPAKIIIASSLYSLSLPQSFFKRFFSVEILYNKLPKIYRTYSATLEKCSCSFQLLFFFSFLTVETSSYLSFQRKAE